MATWIFILHTIFPLSDFVQPDEAAADATEASADDAIRYRGIERMFAKFAAEDA